MKKTTSLDFHKNRTRKTKRWLGILSFFMMILLGQMSFAQTVQIGSGTSNTNNIPVHTWYGYNYSQQIITASEINMPEGSEISKLRWYIASNATMLGSSNQWTVYISTTTKEIFDNNSDYVSVDDLTQVFTGTVTPENGAWMEVIFDTPFEYDGISNLVIAVNETGASYLGNSSTNTNFGSYTSQANTGIYVRRDNPGAFNLTDVIPAGTRVSTLARLQLYFEEDCVTPVNLSATNITVDSAVLGWISEGALFDVEWGIAGFIPTGAPNGTDEADITSNTFSLNGLTSTTSYEFYVRQDCGTVDGTSSWEGPYSFTTACDLPDAPTGITFTAVTATGTTINYTAPDEDPTGYVIFRSTSNVPPVLTNGTTYTTSQTTAVSSLTADGNTYFCVYNGTGLSGSASSLTSNTEYYYYVFSRNSENSCFGAPWYSTTALSSSQMTAPATPTAYVLNSVGFDNASISWTASVSGGSAGILNYWVEVYTDSGYTMPIIGSPFSTGTNTTYNITELTQGTTYFVRIKSNNGEADSTYLTGNFTTTQPGQVGSGTSTNTNLPIYSPTAYNYSQQIYTQAQIETNLNVGENFITKIKFFYNGTGSGAAPGAATSTANFENWTVYLGNTTKTSFTTTTDWVEVDDMQESYSGTVTFPTPGNWMEILLDTPFQWDGVSNIVVAVDENSAGTGSTVYFRSFTSSTDTGIYRRITTDIDPASPGTATSRTGTLAQIVFDAIETPDCFPVTGLTATPTSLTEADISWTASEPIPAGGYEYAVTTSATPPALGTATTSASASVSGLTSEGTHYLHVRQDCGSGDYSPWTTISFYLGYCVPTGAANNADEIRNFTLNNLNNDSAASEGTAGYINYSGSVAPAQVEIGVPATASLTSGTGTGTHGAAIWIDYNQNGVFDTDEKVAWIGNTIGASATVSFPAFIVPNTVTPGIYRLRIMYRYLASGETFVPCVAGSTFSEIEDYSVQILPAPACLAPTDLTATDITYDSAVLGWISVGTLFDIEIVEEGEVPTGTPTYAGVANDFETTIPLTPLTSYEFYVRQDCGSGQSTWTGPFSFTTECLPPSIPGTISGEVCGQGEVTLSATTDVGATIAWYANENDGSKLAEGATFTTPLISETTSYWVAAFTGSNGSAGKLVPNSDAITSSSTNYGIRFTANESITLESISVFSSSNGTLNVKITNDSGTEIYETGNINITNGGLTTSNIIPIEFSLLPGDYRVLIKSSSGVNLYRDSSGLAFPYVSDDEGVVVTSGDWSGATTSYYYYFYDLQYSIGCYSERTEVVATVTEAPELELSFYDLTICNGESDAVLTIISGVENYDNYSWLPATGIEGTEETGWTFNTIENTTYVLTAVNSVSGCVITKEITVIADQSPILNLPEELEVCSGSIVELNSGITTYEEFINEAFSNGTTFPEGWNTVVGSGDTVAVVAANTAGGIANQIRITGNSQSANVTNRAYYGPIDTSGFSELSLQWNNFVNHYSSNPYNYSVKIQTSSDGVVWNDTDWVFSPVTVSQTASVVNTLISTSDVGSSTFYVSFTAQGQTFGMHNWNIDNVILSGEGNGSVIWSPITNLYTDTEATIPYTAGEELTIVYFKGDSGNTYTTTATSANGCTTTESVEVTVNPIPQQPVIACYETATFNQTTCEWEVTGTQPEQPVTACYETATFNTITCEWEVTGEQPEEPVTACYETAMFNTITCEWEVTGEQPEQPILACYQTGVTFNTITCEWEVTGEQPEQPLVACYETAIFNEITCEWDVTGEQPEEPVVACYETATFNDLTCEWDVTGEQPEEPVVACYETATFNDLTCEWDVTGEQPAAPIADSPQSITTADTIADIIVDGENLTWYSDSDLTTIVDETFVLTEGSYTFWVTQTVGGCESQAIEIQVEVTLSRNDLDNASFRTYPNPVKDFFNVSYTKEITNISVVNMLGQTVISKAVNATDTQIDMTSLPTGSYFVKVTVEGNTKTVKVIKQ